MMGFRGRRRMWVNRVRGMRDEESKRNEGLGELRESENKRDKISYVGDLWDHENGVLRGMGG
jgi:hypothetical protein